MGEGEDVRWLQRLSNYERAVDLLRQPVARGLATLSMLEKEGTAQRFELASELAWKTLKDYLQAQGLVIQPLTPRSVIKEAFSAGILLDGQLWIDMLNHRNLLAHTYSEPTLEDVMQAVQTRYLPALEELRVWLAARRTA